MTAARGSALSVVSEAITPETPQRQMTKTNKQLAYENQQLMAALKDTIATLMALSAKHQDGLELLVGTSVYNARKVIAETQEVAS